MRVDTKLFCGLLLVVAVAQALPAESRAADSRKLGRVELEKDAEEIPLPDLPERPAVYDGFLGGINDLFERMRQQMLYLMSHVPRIGFGTPEGGNTTSVTKIIDGHKVVINETVYTSGDGEDAAAVFKVRVVDIRPDSSEGDSGDSGDSSSVADGPKGSVESLELSQENEIPKSLKTVHQQKRKVANMDYLDGELTKNFNNLETFDSSNDLVTFDEPDNTGLETFDEVFNNELLETFDEDIDDDKESVDNSIENEIEPFDHEHGPVIDLSNDIHVNKIAEQNGRAPNPDSEFVPAQPPRDLSRDIYINEIAKNYGRPQNPDAEVFDPSSPFSNNENNVYDLSRDTYVNEIGNLPINPDAEFIPPFPRSRYYYRTDNS